MTHSFPNRRSSDLSHSGLKMRKGRVHIFIGPAGLTQPMANGGAVDAHCQGIIQESDRVSNPASQIQAICEIGEQVGIVRRSEEHTSELQSLMRISYAVFCLKKKKKL